MHRHGTMKRAILVLILLSLVVVMALSAQARPMEVAEHAVSESASTVIESMDDDNKTVYLPVVTSAYMRPIVPDTTRVLTDDTTQHLVSVSKDGAILTFATMTPELEALEAGDVIVSDVTAATPYGFLRRVSSPIVTGEQVTLTTTSATLEDAIQQGRVSFSKQLTPGDIQSVTALPGVSVLQATDTMQGSTFHVEINDVVIYDQDGDFGTTQDQVGANGGFQLEPSVHFDYALSGRAVQDFEFIVDLQQTVEMEFESGVTAVAVEESVELIRLSLGAYTIFVGNVPVVFVIEMPIYLRADGDVSVGCMTSVTQQADLSAGRRYEDGSWTSVGDLDIDFAFEAPKLWGGAELRGYIDTPLSLNLYGVAGPFATTNPYLKLEADVLDDPWWELYGGLDATVGLKGEVLGRSLGEHTETVIGFRQLLAQADSGPPSAITNIVFDPSSPARLHYRDTVDITFDYATTYPGGFRMWAVGYADGDVQPYKASPLYNGPASGTATRGISVWSGTGTVTIDTVRFSMVMEGCRTTLVEFTVPVEYNYIP